MGEVKGGVGEGRERGESWGEERPVVSVLIVTWNSREDVLRCLASVQREGATVPLEVVVVDNGSTDGTVSAIREEYPEVTIRENEGNVGFPRANNQAFELARGRHVLYLNPDTELGAGTLAACVEVLGSETDVGVVGCRLVYPDGETQLESARRHYRLRDLLSEALWFHMLFPRSPTFNHHLMAEWDHLGDRDVEAISGAFMLARREVVEAVGGLPEDVFMYHEDLSFCLRVQRAGWRIRYLGGVTTVHYSGRSATRSPARLYLLEGVVKVRLIREAQGAAMGAAARAVFGLRSLVRLVLVSILTVVPGLGRLKRRYPKVFHLQKHFLQLVWSVAPWAVRPMLPVPDETPEGG
jgi:hypothetical protein